MDFVIDPEIGAILSNITQALTAIGVIATAVSSVLNRRKLEKMDTRLIAAAVEAGRAAERSRIAAHNTTTLVAKTDEVIDKITKLNGNGKP